MQRTICFQCALEALNRGAIPRTLNESPFMHAALVHPAGELDPKRRADLETRFGDKVRSWAESVR